MTVLMALPYAFLLFFSVNLDIERKNRDKRLLAVFYPDFFVVYPDLLNNYVLFFIVEQTSLFQKNYGGIRMNLDFHYYGTYCAALMAQFTPEQAEKIAWAAQTVDECTENYLKSTRIDKKNWVVTCETTEELIADNISFDFYDTTLKKIRRIWMPFHFLPGNLDEHLDVAPKLNTKDNRPDIRCICTHNSILAKMIINHTKELFAATKPLNDEILYLIGIRMHVLADTFAHEFFTGTPNYHVNNVGWKGFKIYNEDSNISNYLSAPPAFSDNSIAYLGHGRLGHLPDNGSRVYEYHPQWANEELIIKRDNGELFGKAFFQMVQALECIKKQETFEPAEIHLDHTPNLIKLAIRMNTLKNIFKSNTGEEACKAWCDYIHVMGFPDLPIYNNVKKDKYDTRLIEFMKSAKIHREMVCAELEKAEISNIVIKNTQ